MGLIIGGVVAVAVIGAGVYMFMGRGGTQPQPGGATGTGPVATSPSTTPGGGTSTPTTGPVVQPPPPVVQTGPSPDEKKATEMIQQAMKLAAKGDYDGGRKKLSEAENFVKSKNLGGTLPSTIQADRAQIDKVQSNKELAATLAKSNDLFDAANSAIAGGQWDRASQSLDQLQGLGEGAAHKDEIPNLRNQIDGGKKLDAQFAQAQSQANSTDEGTLISAKATLDAIAKAGGRHADQASTLSKQFGTKIEAMKAEKERAAVAAAAADRKAKVTQITGEVHQLESAHDFAAARAKLSELQSLGENTNALSSELESAEKSYVASQHTASCAVAGVTHQKYSAPVKPGQDMGQPFLDTDLKLSPGANCGLPAAQLTKGEWRLLVSIDTNGSVADATLLTGDPSVGAKIISQAKSSWHFDAPKANGQPVKTKVAVVVRVN